MFNYQSQRNLGYMQTVPFAKPAGIKNPNLIEALKEAKIKPGEDGIYTGQHLKELRIMSTPPTSRDTSAFEEGPASGTERTHPGSKAIKS